MSQLLDPVLQAIVRATVEGTHASQGWILRLDQDSLRIVAAAGGDGPELLGVEVAAGRGTAGFVIESGAPLALTLRDDDPRSHEGVAELLESRPTSLLTVPCVGDHEVIGVLELVDKVDGSAFSFHDAELATLLASVAGASLAHGTTTGPVVPPPAEVSANLHRLAASDPTRYATIAAAVSTWLGHG